MRLPSLTCLLSIVAGVLAATRNVQKRAVPAGYVTTNGTEFELDGEPFAFVGTNSFWLPLLTTTDDVDATFETMASMGVKVVRTWVSSLSCTSFVLILSKYLDVQAFNMINATELPGALESGLTYYQLWNNSDWTLNEGPQGLQRLDYVVDTAAKYDIRLILTFANNWFGYGGMELYIYWLLGPDSTHDEFYTDALTIASYQRYVQTIVNRYQNSSTIFAWELMNEARCAGDSLPSGSDCVPGSETLTTWYQLQSDFVRSLDPYHMITTGGEGQFYWAEPEYYWYDGQYVSDFNYNAGEDFEASLRLPNIDFGTYHMYPQTWYPELDYPGSNFSVEAWGLNWMYDHIATADVVEKPVIIEEFGALGLDNKSTIYPVWVNFGLESRHAFNSQGVRIQPWQFGMLNLTEDGGNRIIKYTDAISNGASPNDGKLFPTVQTPVFLDI
ncbi:Mannan endo-1,4-beta-mannosidase F [Sparassis crispa]|uniref:mannan endo-1,4-beta-mannosidase n=1 Tax=Sparassis crispa TaxID=139825 RepID=A0A401G7R7_9APHY|nr:Mannan endo-1,4-beta-mannosidase F [Sparassis crispa]GBE78211.1 Mannan endo-1,4-beta-mannosidase F [Sparassis crispa]